MFRLIYKSKSIVEVDQETVKDIIEHSAEMNEKFGITGALVATKTHFLQVLEGDYKAVNHRFFKITSDPRHHDIELIHFGAAEKRLFDGWLMKGFGIFDLNVELERHLKNKYGEEDGGVRFPTEEWAALSLMHDIRVMT